MAKIQAVWAIDIGQAALKALKLVPSDEPDKLYAEAFDYVEYPKILSQPDADPEELVRDALSTFMDRNDLKGSKIAIGVPGQSGLVKFIKLPPVEKKRVPDIVKFEARQQIPFALEEVVWDYQAIGGDDDDDDEITMTEVGLFAMKRDQINRAILPLKNAGLEVDVVQMSPIALYNFLAFDNPPAKGEKGEQPDSYVLLDIGADNTDLIITDGVRIWQRNVPIGGSHFTRALTKELKLTFAKAEHLKKNATKAQDPRAVFTAMRGVFNDFSSEVSRSLGFYGSVNRQAKIAKIIGMGNGFKLPGLQKFLQQNINQDVERLESFQRLTGDEVISAPQFVENLPSFAVAYGLGVQALGRGGLATNLLPPEIQQTRMIRRKKPWALAASTLMMLGGSALFFGSWNALAKTKPFEEPAQAAQAAADQGKKLQTEFDTAKGEFETLKAEGNDLVSDTPETASWPGLLQTLMAALPNPGREFQQSDPNFDPNAPANVGLLGMLRVHVDKIVPVWREDLKGNWYDQIDRFYLNTMHALDQEKAPEGAGWVIQVVGHHYNPSPLGKKTVDLSEREKKFAFGPLAYIQQVVLPSLWRPQLRLNGIHHATLTYFYPDTSWTTEVGATKVPPPPMLRKDSPPAGEGGGGAGGDMAAMMGKMGGPGGMGAMMGGGMGESEGGGGYPGMGGMGGMMGGRGGMMGGMMGPGGMGGAGKKGDEKDIKTLTRTDFKIEFVWQPPKPEDLPKDQEALKAKLEEIVKSLDEAQKQKGAIKPLEEQALTKLSVQQSMETIQKIDAELRGQSDGAAGDAVAPAAGPPAGAEAAAAGPAPAEGAAPANGATGDAAPK